MIRFANWWFLLLIPVVIYLFIAAKSKRALRFSSVRLLKSAGNIQTKKHKIGKLLVLCGVIVSLIAMARPQTTLNSDFLRQRGIDIAILLDISGTMQSVDFEPNRLEAARKTIDDFITGRTDDRISLIVFARAAFTRIPLTLDHKVVRESLASVKTATPNQDGTAIGMAISVGLNRLKKSDAASRIMILVTDGDNNAGAIDPETASKIAQELGIRIYTIGVGTDSLILPAQVFGQTQYRKLPGGFDETLLVKIAEMTGGQYFRAKDPNAMARVFETIDNLEKTEFDNNNFREYNELAFPLIMATLMLLTAGIILDRYHYIQIP